MTAVSTHYEGHKWRVLSYGHKPGYHVTNRAGKTPRSEGLGHLGYPGSFSDLATAVAMAVELENDANHDINRCLREASIVDSLHGSVAD